MRTQQRSFVVEIKSTRRQLKTQPKSIWGNTDFKALARDADASLPFMHNAVLEPSPHLNDLPVEREQGAAPVIASTDIPPPVVPSMAEDDTKLILREATSTVEPAVDVNKTPKHLRKAVPNRQKSTAMRLVEHGSEVRPILVAGDQAEIPSGELTLLLADNRRLKLLLVEHLRRENAQLQQMLKRFKTD
jgi:hypothetical protein